MSFEVGDWVRVKEIYRDNDCTQIETLALTASLYKGKVGRITHIRGESPFSDEVPYFPITVKIYRSRNRGHVNCFRIGELERFIPPQERNEE